MKVKNHQNQVTKFLTSRCSTVPLRCTGQFLSRGFVVLLRKNVPQNHNLKTAAELGVRLLGGANLAAQRLAFTEQKMSTHRVYKSHEFMQPAEKEPIRSVVVESSHSVIVAWHVEPGQTIAPHIHPDGQDTWTILSGEGQYQIDEQGNTVAIVPGDIVVANKGQVHGVLCTSVGPLRFISVVAPLDAGYEPLSAKT
ncbi:TPA: cupin domain-containing protein [Pseudomonas aeruginosa]